MEVTKAAKQLGSEDLDAQMPRGKDAKSVTKNRIVIFLYDGGIRYVCYSCTPL